MRDPVLPRLLRNAGIALAALPLLILTLFYAYVVRARLAVGHWPQPYQPESWSMGFTWHYRLLRPWFLVIPLGLLPVAAGLYALMLWVVSRRFPRVVFGVLFASGLIVYTCIVVDPGRFITWFLD